MRRRSGQPSLAWLKGGGFLVFHIDVFLVAVTAMVLLNIARSPGHIWVTGVLWRWGLLLVIHGMVTLLIWLVSMLLSEERPGAGTYEAEWSAVSRDGSDQPILVEPVETAGGTSRWFGPQDEDGDTQAESSDDAWNAPRAAPATADDWHAGFEQRTSWAETSASAWLARRRGEQDTTADVPAGDGATEQPRPDA